jgi:hypothetical protein
MKCSEAVATAACGGNASEAIKVKRTKYRDNFFIGRVISFLCGIWRLKL